jgi:zinc transporter ZupT
MVIASFLTLIAVACAAAGLSLGRTPFLPAHVAAAGGGLLFGLSLFWVLPEVAESAGPTPAWVLALGVCGLLILLDRMLLHDGQAHGHVLAPLLIATAVHSFVDGWSVRAIAINPLANLAVALGLALHKGPEGLAVGWICRRSIASPWKAATAALVVEVMTLVGAWVEPRASRSAVHAFGPWWTPIALSIIAGTFLFVGIHALLPNRKRLSVVGTFLLSLGLVACASRVRRGAI